MMKANLVTCINPSIFHEIQGFGIYLVPSMPAEDESVLQTFSLQPTNEGFYHCLDIWTVFLDYLSTKLEARNSNADSVIAR